MAAAVPRKVIVASAVPSPAVKLRPVVPASVRLPLVTLSVTWLFAPAASRSAIEIWLPLADEKTLAVSSLVLCAPGTVLTGASLTAVTVMLLLAVALLNAVEPPLLVVSAVRPAVPVVWSHARKLRPFVTVPFQLAFGTKRNIGVAVGGQQPRRDRARAAEGVPGEAAVGAPPPAAVGVDDAGDGNAGQGARIGVGDLPLMRADTRVPGLLTGSSRIVPRLLAREHRRLVDAHQRQRVESFRVAREVNVGPAHEHRGSGRGRSRAGCAHGENENVAFATDKALVPTVAVLARVASNCPWFSVCPPMTVV